MKRINFLIIFACIGIHGSVVAKSNQKKLNDNVVSFNAESRYVLHSSRKNEEFMLTNRASISVIEMLDTNNDGALDFIRYNKFNTQGEKILEVQDCGMDGTPDQRWHYPNSENKSYIEIWFKGKWREVKKSNNSFILVAGKEVDIEMFEGCLRASTSNK